MANYLVTGAAGFIGAALAKRLRDENNEVVTIDNLSTGYLSNIPGGVRFIEGDCSDPLVYDQLEKMHFDVIFHIAGQSSGEISFDDPIYDIRTNVESTLLLLKYALKNNCKRFIYAGTMSVYGEKPDRPIREEESCSPQSFYGVGKLASEHYMRIYQKYGIESTSLRLFNVYGPGQNLENLRQGMISIFLAQMLNNGHIHVKGAADRYRDFVYIDDVVDAFIRCLRFEQSYGEVINIGTGKRTTVGDVVKALCLTQNKEISVEYAGNTEGDIHGIYADVSRMESHLGMKAKTPFDIGIERMLSWVNGES